MADSIESTAVDGEDDAHSAHKQVEADEDETKSTDDANEASKICTTKEEKNEDESNESGRLESDAKAGQVEEEGGGPTKETSLDEDEETILIAPDIQLEEIESDDDEEERMDCLPADATKREDDEEEETVKNAELNDDARNKTDGESNEVEDEEENVATVEKSEREAVSALSSSILMDTELISSDDECLNQKEDEKKEDVKSDKQNELGENIDKDGVSVCIPTADTVAKDAVVNDEAETAPNTSPVPEDIVVLECKADNVVDPLPSEDAGIGRDRSSVEDVESSKDAPVADGVKDSVEIVVIEKVDVENASVEDTDTKTLEKRMTTDDRCIGVDEGDEVEEMAEDGDMPRLAIMDVRTVVEEERTSVVDKNVNEESGASTDVDKENDSAQIPPKEAKEKEEATEAKGGSGDDDDESNNKSNEKNKQANEDADMKSYAADTMNELLGLFGYEKVDDDVKDSLLLSKKGDSDETGESVDKNATDVTKCSDSSVASKNGDASASKDGDKSVVVGGKAMAQGRQCSVCGKTRSCKYQVLMSGMTKFLCDDTCFMDFRTKQNIMATPTIKQIVAENRPVTRSITHPKDYCNVCQKEIKNGMGLLPGVGENKPLCSEECMRNYQVTQGLKRACAQCGGHILSRTKCLTWEAMEFCNEECLGKYQSYLGSHCAFCNNAVQQTSLGKYCVRFGSDIKQFCSNTCLEEFKKGLKICSYCQKDISSGTEGFLAPVGEKGQFKEFCTQSCMEKYETMGNPTITQPSIQKCSVCNKLTTVKVEVTFEGKANKLCSESCIAAFRYANKINTSICDTCHKFFDLDVSRQLSIQIEGSCKRFCTKACMNVFVLHHRKVVPCSWCKVKKYNFDMIERVDSNNHVQLFCSLNCLSLFRVSLNATSSRRIQCDYCHLMKPAQYHLTMSDASIRNFCSYPCVMQFQSQFTAVAPVVSPQSLPATAISKSSTQTNNQTSTMVTTQQSGTPIISSVMSLAPAQSQTQVTGASKPLLVRQQVLPSVISKNLKSAQTQTLYPAITQHVVIKQPVAKMLKNKTILCKPTVQTKGVSCKPHPCHKTTQTEEETPKQVFVPIPVPIYVPVPMHMYTTPVPFPLAFPIPIPVPIFIPTTKNSAQGIFKQIKEIQEKIPDNPFEADLILMAEMVAEDNPSKDKSRKSAVTSTKSSSGLDLHSTSNPTESGSPETANENFNDMESELHDSCQTTNSFGEEVLQMALRMASGMDEPVDLEAALAGGGGGGGGGGESNSRDSLNVHDENGSYLSARDIRAQARCNKRTGGRGRGRGRKRARMEEQTRSPPSTPQTQLPQPPPPYSYGVNAWKHWVLQKNTQLEKASQTNRKLKLFKTDILQLTADELNYSLCLFVKEVRKPNGEEYASDSIYYLCLGIQQYLFENGRIDNIFADTYYEKFTECLNDVLVRYEVTVTREGVFLSRIEEEILWECKQLGAHSPHVLLNTLMYFNTKYFMLKTVDEHTQLSFSHILKHWKKGPGGSGGAGAPSKVTSGTPGRSALLRYYPPSQMKDSSRRRKEVIPSYEQVENLDNPLRCPVKLYEFYLSKCPESIKNRNDIFYLYPERSCVPDSPVWYSTLSLGKETITKMLQRIKMVREVGENMMLS